MLWAPRRRFSSALPCESTAPSALPPSSRRSASRIASRARPNAWPSGPSALSPSPASPVPCSRRERWSWSSRLSSFWRSASWPCCRSSSRSLRSWSASPRRWRSRCSRPSRQVRSRKLLLVADHVAEFVERVARAVRAFGHVAGAAAVDAVEHRLQLLQHAPGGVAGAGAGEVLQPVDHGLQILRAQDAGVAVGRRRSGRPGRGCAACPRPARAGSGRASGAGRR